jgi:SAM-dependent methyltransferase
MTQHPPPPNPAPPSPAQRKALEDHLRRARDRFDRTAAGIAPRLCPICGYAGPFAPYGSPPRLDARCPGCGSLERHRLVALALERRGLLSAGMRLLHFAAEAPLRRVIAPRVASYETAEFRAATKPTHVLNIEAIALPDESFDVVVCNHVLEHVDDRKALSEMRRILRPGGLAVLTTPVVEGWAETYENPAVTTAEGRTLHFGQGDHLRFYGRDIRDRIRAAGFALDEVTAVEPDVHRHGLVRGETVFLARRDEERTA